MAMVRKGQLRKIGGRDMRAQATFVAELFQVPPDLPAIQAICGSPQTLQHNLFGSMPNSRAACRWPAGQCPAALHMAGTPNPRIQIHSLHSPRPSVRH
jgi:hypothetical protein